MEWRWVMYVCAFGLQQQMSLLPNRINVGHLIFSPAEAPYRTVNLKPSVRAGHSQHWHATTAEKTHTPSPNTNHAKGKKNLFICRLFLQRVVWINNCFTNKALSGINRKQTNGCYLTKLWERGRASSGTLTILHLFSLSFHSGFFLCAPSFFFPQSHYWKNK